MPNPPVTIPFGQSVVWSFPTAVDFGPQIPGSVNGSASATLNGAFITMTQGSSLGNNKWTAVWSDFVAPSLLDGTTIENIYPVIVAYGTTTQSVPESYAGPLMDINVTSPIGGVLGVTSGVFSDEYHSGSLGSTSADITSCKLGVRLFDTVPDAPYFDTFVTTYAALAIYFTPAPVVFGHQPVVSVSVGTTTLLSN